MLLYGGLAVAALLLLSLHGLTLEADRRLGYFAVLGLASVVFISADLVAALGPAGSVLGPAGASVAVLLGLILSGRSPRWPPYFYLYAISVVLGLLAAIPTDLKGLFAPIIALSTLIYALGLGALNEREWATLRRGLIVMAVVVAVLCFAETFVFNRLLFPGDGYGLNPIFPDRVRGQATLGHPIVAGFFMLVATTLTLLSHRRLLTRLVVSAVLMVGVIATGSSSTLAIAAVSLGLVWIVRGATGINRIFRAGAVAVAVVLTYQRLVPASVTDDLSGVNTTHRLNTIEAVPRLLTEQSFMSTYLGNGYVPLDPLYLAGIFTNDFFFTLDNQYVSVLVTSGVVGFVLFVAYLVRVIAYSRSRDTVAVILLSGMFLSFDVLQWAPSATLFVIAAALATRRPTSPADPPTQDELASSRQHISA